MTTNDNSSTAESKAKSDATNSAKKAKRSKDLMAIAKKCHEDFMEDSRLRNDFMEWLGMSLVSINKFLLGAGEFYGKKWFTVPIIENGECRMIRLREIVDGREHYCAGDEIAMYPSDAEPVLFGMTDLKKSRSDSVLICGDVHDRIVALQMGFGMPVVSGTDGEETFEDYWIDLFDGRVKFYICFGANKKSKGAMLSLSERIHERWPLSSVYNLPLPEEMGGSLFEACIKPLGGSSKLLGDKELIAGSGDAKTTNFAEMSIKDLAAILDQTIKHDYYNKIIVFLAMLSMYTDEQQMNVSLNGRSSSGKTYIAQEVAKFFPKMDYVTYNRISPTGLFHLEDERTTNEKGEPVVDLERKTLILLDQTGTQLQQNLRPLLSHDEKMLRNLITNSDSKGRNVSKHEYIKGYCSTIWCSANLKMDEQEQTRVIVLSPETSAGKLHDTLRMIGERESNAEKVSWSINENWDRANLVYRVYHIRSLNIKDVEIPEEFNVVGRFEKTLKKVLPRHQRDLQHLYSLIKAHALLNAPTREIKETKVLIAKGQDVDEAFEIWDHIKRSQSSGVPAQVLQFYDYCLSPLYLEKYPDGKGKGVTYEELQARNYAVDGEMLNPDYIRKQFIPILKSAGMISEERDPIDKRQKLIKPLILPIGENQTVKN